MRNAASTMFLIGAMCVVTPAWAQTQSGSLGLIVYPGQGQSAEQTAKDEGECFAWAQETTGVDPNNPLAGVETAPPPAQGGGGAAAGAGAVRGAAGGALLGNLADEDAGEWALAGAAIGSIRGAKQRQKHNEQQQAQSQAQTQAQAQERVELYTKAFTACMEGRSYTVK